jgi:superoxide dismutase, Cu-Zn family
MRSLALVTLISLGLCGCGTMTQGTASGSTARADIRNANKQPAGMATFTEGPGGVRIVVEAKGLPPGAHGLHIHEVGKCEPAKFTTAGEHFNPEKKQHGTENPSGPHAGDLSNITIGPDGTGRLETTTNRLTLASGPMSVFDADGSAIVIHAAPDDYRTDPTGNSGDRIACGVIEKTPSRPWLMGPWLR